VTETLCDHSVYHTSCCSCWDSGRWVGLADGRRLVRDGAVYPPAPLAMPWSTTIWASSSSWTLTALTVLHLDGRNSCSGTRTIQEYCQRAFRRGWAKIAGGLCITNIVGCTVLCRRNRVLCRADVDRGKMSIPNCARATILKKEDHRTLLWPRTLGLNDPAVAGVDR